MVKRGEILVVSCRAHRGHRDILTSGGRIAANEFAGMIRPFLPTSRFLLLKRVLCRRWLTRQRIAQSRGASVGVQVLVVRDLV